MPSFDLSSFTFEKFIGEGTFGSVKRYRSGSQVIAVKKFNKFGLDCIREISVLKKLSFHENIVKILGFVDEATRVISLVVESMENDLTSMLRHHTHGISFTGSSKVYSMLRNGINYIHSQGFMHRDLKPHNILCTKQTNYKVVDSAHMSFGLTNCNRLAADAAQKNSECLSRNGRCFLWPVSPIELAFLLIFTNGCWITSRMNAHHLPWRKRLRRIKKDCCVISTN